jgi:hypothetical protein
MSMPTFPFRDQPVYKLIKTVFSSVHASKAKCEYSRPSPLPFHPPNGMSIENDGEVQLMPHIPASYFFAIRRARLISFVKTEEYRPNSVSVSK